MNHTTQFRSLWLLFSFMTLSLIIVGCGGSQEAMPEDEMVTDIGYADETPDEGIVEQTDTLEEVLPDTTEPIQMVPEGPTTDQLQSELDGLKTENIQLKDQLSNKEQANRDLMAKISDLEAANQALKKQNEQKPAPPKVVMTPAAPGKSSAEEIRAYKSSVAKFNARMYRDAISELQTLLNTGVKDDYADNCHYWIGLSYFQLKEYTTAIEQLQLVKNYRFSEKKDDAQMMIARSYERLGNKAKALAEYKKLVDLYPTSEYVGRAKAKIR